MSRLLVVTNDFPPRRGGIETFVSALCERMDRAEVVVYTASMAGDREYDASLPFPVYRDPSSMLLPLPSVGRRVERVMSEHGCDRVLFGASAPLGLLGRRLRRAGAQRIVALTHGHEVWWAKLPVTRQLLRRIGDSVDVMTYVSQWCRERIAPAMSPAAAARMVRLSPGVDTERFFPGCGGEEVRGRLGIPLNASVVVCTARMVKRKGQDTLVKAWPAVLRSVPDARLLLVGDGPNRARVENLARSLGVSDSVVFTSSVPAEEIPAHTDAGDVFAMPCRTRRFGLEAEAFGIVFLEAQACGLPVLVGNSGGAPEALVDERFGAVIEPDHASVARGLVLMLGNAADLRVAGPAAEGVTSEISRTRSWRTVTDVLRGVCLLD
ncbi:MAG TPA: glycosyltransferase family 4 protein [Nocardioidaceae bacterium]|nr:glycosyltransferase family 4 protein [Nocardioidaceae bacterium]